MGILQLLSINPSYHQNNKLCYDLQFTTDQLAAASPALFRPWQRPKPHSQCPAWRLGGGGSVGIAYRSTQKSCGKTSPKQPTVPPAKTSFLDLKFETRRMVRQRQPQTWKPSANCFLETFETANSPLACSVWRNL